MKIGSNVVNNIREKSDSFILNDGGYTKSAIREDINENSICINCYSVLPLSELKKGICSDSCLNEYIVGVKGNISKYSRRRVELVEALEVLNIMGDSNASKLRKELELIDDYIVKGQEAIESLTISKIE